MEIISAVNKLVEKVQIYNIPPLPVQSEELSTIFNLQDAVETAIDIIAHLRDEEYISYQIFNYSEAMQAYGISLDGSINPENPEVVPDALLWKQQFRSSFLSRLSTYIITICGLDGILSRAYEDFLEALKVTKYSSLIPSENSIEEMIKKRSEEINCYSKLRNKVFAHTSYSQPKYGRKIDSEELQSISLGFYSGASMRYATDHVYITIEPPLIEGNAQIKLSIFGDYFTTIMPHYESWSSMFTEILDKL